MSDDYYDYSDDDDDDDDFVYDFKAETPRDKVIDMNFYFDINCKDMPIQHINATYSLLHKIMRDATLEEDTRQDLIKILLNFDYGNRTIRKQLQKAISSLNQNRETRPMYDNIQEDSI